MNSLDKVSDGAPDGLAATPHGFLADLTGRRAWLAALILLIAYLVPTAVVRLVAQAAQAGLLGDSMWLPTTVAIVCGVALIVPLTIRFGGWFQAISFGEEYMLTFHPVKGYALGWWRFAAQLGGLMLAAYSVADMEHQVTLKKITNAQTSQVDEYSARAPIPHGWEQQSTSWTRNEYADWPNATYVRDFVVPASVGVEQVEKWFGDRQWRQGVAGKEPFGALERITCETEYSKRCEARVVPEQGEESEYSVEVSFLDVNVRKDGELVPAQLLKFAVEYEAAH